MSLGGLCPKIESEVKKKTPIWRSLNHLKGHKSPSQKGHKELPGMESIEIEVVDRPPLPEASRRWSSSTKLVFFLSNGPIQGVMKKGPIFFGGIKLDAKNIFGKFSVICPRNNALFGLVVIQWSPVNGFRCEPYKVEIDTSKGSKGAQCRRCSRRRPQKGEVEIHSSLWALNFRCLASTTY